MPDFLISLRPAAGRKMPGELRASRVGAKAEELAGGVRDPGFAGLLARIDGGTLDAARRLVPYFDGDKALAAMRRSIDDARREVLVESYIFADDATGRAFAEALIDAVGRGVVVRVLADAFGSFETRNEFWSRLRRHGVEVRHFHPLLAAFLWHQFRDHRKLLVVDRRVAYTGGMNIAVKYSRRRKVRKAHARAGLHMRDTHLLAEGPVARSLAAVFDEGWRRAGGTTLPAELDGGVAAKLEGDDGRPVLVVDSRPGRGSRETAATLAAVLGAARRSVWLTMGYFAPHRGAVRSLERAASRGCDVRLLLPGPTDVPLVRHAGHASFRRLLDAGVRIWEYEQSVLHAKTLVVDDHASIVGSANLDVRSRRLNAECGLLALDDRFARSLSEAFLLDLESSEEIASDTWRRRGMLHRLGDRLAGLLTPLL